MEIGDKIVSRIEELMCEHRYTLTKLSTRSGLTQSTLYNFMSRNNDTCTMRTLEIVCTYGFEISLFEFFDSDLFTSF